MGDAQSEYGYSGIRLSPAPWTSAVNLIRQRINALTGCEFNSVLLNRYRSGQDSVAWHADDEPELGPDPIIASVSFGCERTFQLKPKKGSKHSSKKIEIVLRNGSIVIMKNGLQNNWVHQIPKVNYEIDERINLTFRTIIS
jgi:alkylated DNA repair dioxygenase AlkB